MIVNNNKNVLQFKFNLDNKSQLNSVKTLLYSKLTMLNRLVMLKI